MLRNRELEAIKQLQQAQIALEQELIEANAAHGEEMRKLKHNQEVNLPRRNFTCHRVTHDSTLTQFHRDLDKDAPSSQTAGGGRSPADHQGYKRDKGHRRAGACGEEEVVQRDRIS